MTGPILFLLLLATIVRGPIHLYTLSGGLAAVLDKGWVTHRIRQRQQNFQLSLYKIYRLLDLQLTSGVNAFDVLKGLPKPSLSR
jgi:hypothetical protein